MWTILNADGLKPKNEPTLMFPVSAKRNQQGKADVLVYDELPEPLKVQTIHIWEALIPKFPEFWMNGSDRFYQIAGQKICKEFGVFRLTHAARNATEDVCNYFLMERDIEKSLRIIELVFDTFVQIVKADSYVNAGMGHDIRQAAEELNTWLKKNRVGYEFKAGQFIRIDSNFLHAEAVIPAMSLLQHPDLAGANQEFQKAQEHYLHSRFAEAINECLKSFESTMKCICSKRGWPYNQNDTAKKLLAVCEDNDLFPPYLSSSLTGLRAVLETVATIRNKQTAHGQGVQQVQVTAHTAAYVIHITAANVVYLASLANL